MSFLSTRLSSMAKTWNRGSAAVPILGGRPLEKMEKREIPRAEKHERLQRLFFLHFRRRYDRGGGGERRRREHGVDIRGRPSRMHILQSKI
ncbi:hypothetical protein NL676_011138 [Syzygium grande]|nr:hypothetical protein NL676_011138 [Syzygium grande]